MSLSFRHAILHDSQLLFAWRNDEITRQNSHSTEEIAWDNHLAWLENSINSPTREIYIVLIDNEAVGTIRRDREKAVVELSWIVAPGARGKGIGTRMLRSFVEREEGPIRAEVKAENLASQRIAEAAGMKMTQKANGICYYRRG